MRKSGEKLLNRPTDFTYNEAKTLLGWFGYEEDNKGRTSGSRVAFVNAQTKHIIRFHKPHPGNFNVRISPELHSKAAREAIIRGITLNQLVENAIKDKVSNSKG